MGDAAAVYREPAATAGVGFFLGALDPAAEGEGDGCFMSLSL
jgi:hypothetical protein